MSFSGHKKPKNITLEGIITYQYSMVRLLNAVSILIEFQGINQKEVSKALKIVNQHQSKLLQKAVVLSQKKNKLLAGLIYQFIND